MARLVSFRAYSRPSPWVCIAPNVVEFVVVELSLWLLPRADPTTSLSWKPGEFWSVPCIKFVDKHTISH